MAEYKQRNTRRERRSFQICAACSDLTAILKKDSGILLYSFDNMDFPEKVFRIVKKAKVKIYRKMQDLCAKSNSVVLFRSSSQQLAVRSGTYDRITHTSPQ